MNLLLENETYLPIDIQKNLSNLGYTIYTDPQNTDLTIIDAYSSRKAFSVYPLESFTQLKFIQLASAGYDFLDIEQIKQRNITLCNARDMFSIPIAEFVLARILEVYKDLRLQNMQQQQKLWKKTIDLKELNQQKALILGTGSIGHEIAVRLKAFGVYAAGVNSNGRLVEGFDEGIASSSVIEHLARFDMVISSLPLNPQTHHLIDQAFIEAMNRNAILVNIGRGPVIDEQALIHALGNHLSAVILDVFEEEPLSEKSLLWASDKLYISSHTSFASPNNENRLNTLFADNLSAYIQNKPLRNIVNL